MEQKYRGVKSGNELFVIKNTNMEACLLEICFITNENDVNIFNSNFDSIANDLFYVITGQTVGNQAPTEKQEVLSNQIKYKINNGSIQYCDKIEVLS
jgi:hypothetical protein